MEEQREDTNANKTNQNNKFIRRLEVEERGRVYMLQRTGGAMAGREAEAEATRQTNGGVWMDHWIFYPYGGFEVVPLRVWCTINLFGIMC